MTGDARCSGCGSALTPEAGFFVDATQGGSTSTRWAAGPPTDRFWLSRQAPTRPVLAARCVECNRLELFVGTEA